MVLSLLLLVIGGAGQAQAVGYRYWSFWDLTGGKWDYATQGPSTARPSDGDVQGFRFAVSADSQDASKPRGHANFASICAKTPAQAGHKRVALVIDSGIERHARRRYAAGTADGLCPRPRRRDHGRGPRDGRQASPLRHQRPPVRHLGLPGEGLRRPGRDVTHRACHHRESRRQGQHRRQVRGDPARPVARPARGSRRGRRARGAAVWQTRRRRP